MKHILTLFIMHFFFFNYNPETTQITQNTFWNISSEQSDFKVYNSAANKQDIDGYYILDGNDKFCFEIHNTEARLSADLEEYANLKNTENRKLKIGDYVDGNIYLSFEGQKNGDIFVYCQEFYSSEDENFITYFHCDENEEPVTLLFIKQN